jgi:hypothetical protein
MSRGGAATSATWVPAIERLMGVYIPLLGILAGFYFAEQSSTQGNSTSIEAFGFATLLICLWVFAPPVLIFSSATVETAIKVLNSIYSVVGTSLASSALAFFFSKSAKPSAASV